MPDNDTKFDYVIVGGGSAGCLLANRLSSEPQNRVLLLEAGKKDSYPWIHIPVGYLYCIGNPRTDWMYNTEPEQGLNGRSQRYPRGKTLGGCSSINGMIYMRGQARDYENWAKLSGDETWNWEHALNAFKAHENHYRLDNGADPITGNNSSFSDLHGHGGEWRTPRERLRAAACGARHRARGRLGDAPPLRATRRAARPAVGPPRRRCIASPHPSPSPSPSPLLTLTLT